MAFSINNIFLVGNVSKDPELKYTQGGTAVCTFSMATNHWIAGKNGEQGKSIATFHRIVAWGKLAENVAGGVHKGTQVTVQGRQENRMFDKQDGTKGYVSEVNADSVIYYQPRAGQSNDPGLPPEPGAVNNSGYSAEQVADEVNI